MKKILFRGKEFETQHSSNGWVYGFYCSKGGAHFITTVGQYASGKEYFSDVLVDPETVGEYIGVTDSNNKKIFEGDIIRETSESPRGCRVIKDLNNYVVVYRNSSFCVIDLEDYRNGKDYYDSIDDSEFGISVEEWYEVFGNIYDNPELLEAK